MFKKSLIISTLILSIAVSFSIAMANGDADRGAQLAVDCADCHGEDGRGDEDIPSIAGIAAAKHHKILADYKSGALESEDMIDYVEDLSDKDLADLAANYATLPE